MLPKKGIIIMLLASFLFASCTKEEKLPPYTVITSSPLPVSPIPTHSGPFVHGNRDYFWALPWHKTPRGYEIHLNTTRLTNDQINKGISVSVAIWTEMTVFDAIPLTFYEHTQKDSVSLSYSAKSGQLEIIAKATFEIKYVSDVFIEYK